MEDISCVVSCGNRWFAMLNFSVKITSKKPRSNVSWTRGATCNVLSYTDLSTIKQDGNPHMASSKTKLKLFDGFVMKPLGEVDLQVLHGRQTRVLKVYVYGSHHQQGWT